MLNSAEHEISIEYRQIKKFLAVSLSDVIVIMLINVKMPTGPEVIQLFSCSTQLSTTFILLINVKMPTIVGILTFISMIKTTYQRLRARNFFTFRYFTFYEQLKFRAQLS